MYDRGSVHLSDSELAQSDHDVAPMKTVFIGINYVAPTLYYLYLQY